MLLKCQTSASLKRVSQQAGQPGSATAGSSSSSGIGSNQFVSGFGASRQPASGKGKGKGGKCIRNAGSVGGTSSVSIGAPQSLVSPSVGVAGKKTFDFWLFYCICFLSCEQVYAIELSYAARISQQSCMWEMSRRIVISVGISMIHNLTNRTGDIGDIYSWLKHKYLKPCVLDGLTNLIHLKFFFLENTIIMTQESSMPIHNPQH